MSLLQFRLQESVRCEVATSAYAWNEESKIGTVSAITNHKNEGNVFLCSIVIGDQS